MHIDNAINIVGRAVEKAPLNMTVGAFHRKIRSLVVRFDDDRSYQPMTVQEWRDYPDPKPEVILCMMTGDSFGG